MAFGLAVSGAGPVSIVVIRRVRVRRRLDRPAEAGHGAVLVAGAVGRADLERVVAEGEAGVAHRRGARHERRRRRAEHSNVEPSSLDENAKLALVSCVIAGGDALIVVSGAVVSTMVQTQAAGRRVDVAGRVDGADLERVPAGVQARIDDRVEALAPTALAVAVEAALELEPLNLALEHQRVVGAGDLEAGRAGVARVGRAALDARVRRRHVLDRPLVDGSATGRCCPRRRWRGRRRSGRRHRGRCTTSATCRS